MCYYGLSTPSEWNSRENGADPDEVAEDVRYRYGSEGLGQERREVDVRHQYDTGSRTRRRSILPDTRLGPTSTLEVTLTLGRTKRRDREPRRWRYHIKRQYQRAREVVNDRLRIAIEDRADRHVTEEGSHEIEVGLQVWLYLDRKKEGYDRKLAHMWHGPFRVIELCERRALRGEVLGTTY